MAIVRWAPFDAFSSLERDMQLLLDRVSAGPWFGGLGWRPPLDMYRENGDLIVRAELPGIDPESGLDLHVEDNVLHIEGEKKLEWETREEDRYLHERRFGSFHREVVLPEGIVPDEVKAAYENGILIVRIPLPQQAVKAQEKVKIEISTPEMQSV